MRILLVEDDPDLSDVAATHLRDHSHAVDVVGTLKMASAALAGVAYDLILLDLGLPDGDGVDWLSHPLKLLHCRTFKKKCLPTAVGSEI